MTGLFKVVYIGEEDGALKKGMPYTVIGVKEKKNDTIYRLEGLTGSYSNTLFQVPKKRQSCLAILRSTEPPIEGKYMKNLLCLKNDGNWEEIAQSDEVKRINIVSGDVYAVHTQKMIYLLHHIPE